MITITMQIKPKNTLCIRINKKQQIQETFMILREKKVCIVPENTYVYIPRRKKQVSIFLTYEEAQVVEGDILQF